MKSFEYTRNFNLIRSLVTQDLIARGLFMRKEKLVKKSRSKEDSMNLMPEGLFGSSLSLVPKQFVDSHGFVPKFLVEAINMLRKHMEVEGLFRKSGALSRMKEIKVKLENGGLLDDSMSPLDVSSLVKQFLREMPEPLMTFELHDLFVNFASLQPPNWEEEILKLCLLLPDSHLSTLTFVMTFFKNLASHSSCNKMDSSNLAVCLAPNILRFRDTSLNSFNQVLATPSRNKTDHPHLINESLIQNETRVVQLLIDKCHQLPLVAKQILENNNNLIEKNLALIANENGQVKGNEEEVQELTDEMETDNEIKMKKNKKILKPLKKKKKEKRRSSSLQGLVSTLGSSFTKWYHNNQTNLSYQSNSSHCSFELSPSSSPSSFSFISFKSLQTTDENQTPYSMEREKSASELMHMLSKAPNTPLLRGNLRKRKSLVSTDNADTQLATSLGLSAAKKKAILQGLPQQSVFMPFTPKTKSGCPVNTPIINFSSEHSLKFSATSSKTPPRSKRRLSIGKSACFSPKSSKRSMRSSFRGLLRRLSGSRDKEKTKEKKEKNSVATVGNPLATPSLLGIKHKSLSLFSSRKRSSSTSSSVDIDSHKNKNIHKNNTYNKITYDKNFSSISMTNEILSSNIFNNESKDQSLNQRSNLFFKLNSLQDEPDCLTYTSIQDQINNNNINKNIKNYKVTKDEMNTFVKEGFKETKIPKFKWKQKLFNDNNGNKVVGYNDADNKNNLASDQKSSFGFHDNMNNNEDAKKNKLERRTKSVELKNNSNDDFYDYYHDNDNKNDLINNNNSLGMMMIKRGRPNTIKNGLRNSTVVKRINNKNDNDYNENNKFNIIDTSPISKNNKNNDNNENINSKNNFALNNDKEDRRDEEFVESTLLDVAFTEGEVSRMETDDEENEKRENNGSEKKEFVINFNNKEKSNINEKEVRYDNSYEKNTTNCIKNIEEYTNKSHITEHENNVLNKCKTNNEISSSQSSLLSFSTSVYLSSSSSFFSSSSSTSSSLYSLSSLASNKNDKEILKLSIDSGISCDFSHPQSFQLPPKSGKLNESFSKNILTKNSHSHLKDDEKSNLGKFEIKKMSCIDADNEEKNVKQLKNEENNKNEVKEKNLNYDFKWNCVLGRSKTLKESKSPSPLSTSSSSTSLSSSSFHLSSGSTLSRKIFSNNKNIKAPNKKNACLMISTELESLIKKSKHNINHLIIESQSTFDQSEFVNNNNNINPSTSDIINLFNSKINKNQDKLEKGVGELKVRKPFIPLSSNFHCLTQHHKNNPIIDHSENPSKASKNIKENKITTTNNNIDQVYKNSKNEIKILINSSPSSSLFSTEHNDALTTNHKNSYISRNKTNSSTIATSTTPTTIKGNINSSNNISSDNDCKSLFPQLTQSQSSKISDTSNISTMSDITNSKVAIVTKESLVVSSLPPPTPQSTNRLKYSLDHFPSPHPPTKQPLQLSSTPSKFTPKICTPLVTDRKLFPPRFAMTSIDIRHPKTYLNDQTTTPLIINQKSPLKPIKRLQASHSPRRFYKQKSNKEDKKDLKKQEQIEEIEKENKKKIEEEKLIRKKKIDEEKGSEEFGKETNILIPFNLDI